MGSQKKRKSSFPSANPIPEADIAYLWKFDARYIR